MVMWFKSMRLVQGMQALKRMACVTDRGSLFTKKEVNFKEIGSIIKCMVSEFSIIQMGKKPTRDSGNKMNLTGEELYITMNP